ncbi:MAG: metallophosphoesterase [Terracidiphilus sp.]
MNRVRESEAARRWAAVCVLCVCCAWGSAGAWAQTAATGEAKPKQPAAPAVEALFVSDIHFEPFWDPAKAVKLQSAPVEQWKAILAGPEAADREAKFAQLQQACHARGADTSNTLFESSLRAIRANAAGAKFVLLSGDLMAHSFSCKFDQIFPDRKPGAYGAFVEKTIEYVMRELRGAVKGVPVYAALGNNDSDCGDYQLDAKSPFLEESGKALAADVPALERAEALKTFGMGGYYSVSLPAPIKHTRLVVLDDVFESWKYATCAGKTDEAPAEEQIAWLKGQLDEARKNKEKVWVMAHIPPGVDPYATAMKMVDVCGGGAPQMFLSSEALPETVARYGDVVRLMVVGHTHMDEVRLLEPVDGEGMAERGIAVKLVGSISPINGNAPSFTLATIDAGTAVMKDYRVIAASNETGVNAKWTEEYDWAKTYKQDGFTAIGVRDEIAGFGADPSAQQKTSQSYIRNYGSGMGARELSLFWKPYLCSLGSDGADGFKKCLCGE